MCQAVPEPPAPGPSGFNLHFSVALVPAPPLSLSSEPVQRLTFCLSRNSRTRGGRRPPAISPLLPQPEAPSCLRGVGMTLLTPTPQPRGAGATVVPACHDLDRRQGLPASPVPTSVSPVYGGRSEAAGASSFTRESRFPPHQQRCQGPAGMNRNGLDQQGSSLQGGEFSSVSGT